MNKRGFTLIELLIVVGLIGLLGTMSAIAIGSARSKMRDAKRLSDVRMLQSALEDHFKTVNQYPVHENLRLGDPTTSRCLSGAGFIASCQGASSVFLQVVPAEFTRGIGRDVTCGVPPQAGYCYTSVAQGGSYRLGFELEHGIKEAGIEKGPNCLIPEAGIRPGVCPE